MRSILHIFHSILGYATGSGAELSLEQLRQFSRFRYFCEFSSVNPGSMLPISEAEKCLLFARHAYSNCAL